MNIKKAKEVKQALYGTGFKPTFFVFKPRDTKYDDIYFGTLEFDPVMNAANYPDDGWLKLVSFDELYMTIEEAE